MSLKLALVLDAAPPGILRLVHCQGGGLDEFLLLLVVRDDALAVLLLILKLIYDMHFVPPILVFEHLALELSCLCLFNPHGQLARSQARQASL